MLLTLIYAALTNVVEERANQLQKLSLEYRNGNSFQWCRYKLINIRNEIRKYSALDEPENIKTSALFKLLQNPRDHTFYDHFHYEDTSFIDSRFVRVLKVQQLNLEHDLLMTEHGHYPQKLYKLQDMKTELENVRDCYNFLENGNQVSVYKV